MRKDKRTYMSDWNTQIIEEFRTNGGKVGGMYEGAPLLLLTTIGKETFDAIASVVDDSERERLLKRWPAVVEHQAKTSRQIPFVALQRVK
jgi:hypothetical protein